MQLSVLDYFIIAAYLGMIVAVGLYFRQRAGENLAEYFLSGRSLPWWVAGTSMVATTFAADTPLAVTGLVIQDGLAGNWVWWCFASGGMITVFVYARLWRRAGVMTDVELVEMRYGGKPAAALRGIRAIYVALIVNPLIIGWVTGAMATLLDETVLYGVEPAAWQVSVFGSDELRGEIPKKTTVYIALKANRPGARADLQLTVKLDDQFDPQMVSCCMVPFSDTGALKADPSLADSALAQAVPTNLSHVRTMQVDLDADEFYTVAITNSHPDQEAIYAIHAADGCLMLSNRAMGARTWLILCGALALVGFYWHLSGMWGVAITDAIQFVLAMLGCILLAIVAVNHLGGVGALQSRVSEQFDNSDAAFRFIPDLTGEQKWMPAYAFLIMLLMQWWATWYPGAEPGGGGYVVQRMASCKDERHSVLATLWYQIAHYCLRPWPWLLVAFAALVMYPELRAAELQDNAFDSGVGFPRVIRDLSPNGLRGLLMVTFFAAFMSTISTQMNWGASYLVRDFYQRFFAQDALDRQLTNASKWASLVVLVSGAIAAYLMQDMSVDAAWKMLLALGAGTGAVFMLRWFWWRINAWSEISSMVASLAFFLAFDPVCKLIELEEQPRPELKMLIIAFMTIIVWVVVTLLTRPESNEVLDRFFQKVRPGGVGWEPVANRNRDIVVDRDLTVSLIAAMLATGIVYFTLPCIGSVIFGDYRTAALCGTGALVCAAIVAILVKRIVSTSSVS